MKSEIKFSPDGGTYPETKILQRSLVLKQQAGQLKILILKFCPVAVLQNHFLFSIIKFTNMKKFEKNDLSYFSAQAHNLL